MPGVVLTANSTGMFDSDGHLIDASGNKVDSDDEDDNDSTTTADVDNVTASEVTLTWHRNGTAFNCDVNGDDTIGDTETCAYAANTATISYTLTDDDVSKTITLVATYTGTKVDDTTETRTHSTSDPAGTIQSTNPPEGAPAITGKTQVGETLTANRGSIKDKDGAPAGQDYFIPEEKNVRYHWFYADEVKWGTKLHVGPTYDLSAKDAGEILRVVAIFEDGLGDTEVLGSAATNVVAGSPGMISKIEPGIRGVVVSGGDSVKLEVEVYGLQGKMDQSLADGITLTWSVEPSSGSLPAAAAGNSTVTYTAPTSPGSYKVTAMVSDGDCQPDDEAMRETACSASFDVRVRRSAPTQPEPAAPANPPGDIPTILTDSAGNQYEVFTPVEGGTFDAGEGYSIVAPSGAVPNGEFIGVRMSDDGSASNAGMTHQRYTLGGNMYGVHVVNSDGGSVSDYPLEEAAKVCVPLPDMFRSNISDLAVVAINGDGSLTILSAQVKITSGGAMVCGNLSNLPASVAVGSSGAPAAIPTATPEPTPEPPATGGTAPASSGNVLWALLLGLATLALGIFLTAGRRRHTNH